MSSSLAALGYTTYAEYRRSEHWRSFRAHVLAQRGRSCHYCGSASRICLHHVSYERLGREAETDVIVLCHDCHGAFHRAKRDPEYDRMTKAWVYSDEYEEEITELLLDARDEEPRDEALEILLARDEGEVVPDPYED